MKIITTPLSVAPQINQQPHKKNIALILPSSKVNSYKPRFGTGALSMQAKQEFDAIVHENPTFESSELINIYKENHPDLDTSQIKALKERAIAKKAIHNKLLNFYEQDIRNSSHSSKETSIEEFKKKFEKDPAKFISDNKLRVDHEHWPSSDNETITKKWIEKHIAKFQEELYKDIATCKNSPQVSKLIKNALLTRHKLTNGDKPYEKNIAGRLLLIPENYNSLKNVLHSYFDKVVYDVCKLFNNEQYLPIIHRNINKLKRAYRLKIINNPARSAEEKKKARQDLRAAFDCYKLLDKRGFDPTVWDASLPPIGLGKTLSKTAYKGLLSTTASWRKP